MSKEASYFDHEFDFKFASETFQIQIHHHRKRLMSIVHLIFNCLWRVLKQNSVSRAREAPYVAREIAFSSLAARPEITV